MELTAQALWLDIQLCLWVIPSLSFLICKMEITTRRPVSDSCYEGRGSWCSLPLLQCRHTLTRPIYPLTMEPRVAGGCIARKLERDSLECESMGHSSHKLMACCKTLYDMGQGFKSGYEKKKAMDDLRSWPLDSYLTFSRASPVSHQPPFEEAEREGGKLVRFK